ncbi:MAG: hypothetical protein WBB28_01840 [Crinalium sp.]
MTTENNANKFTVLDGHVSFDSAYIIQDYPYGRSLRCKRACWLEQATKGAKAELFRFMACTTDPKRTTEVWNKPKASTYGAFSLMYIDEETGHLHHAGIGEYPWEEHWESFSAKWRNLMPEEMRLRFDEIMSKSIKRSQAINAVYAAATERAKARKIEELTAE